jgi:hypothetical protein
MVRSCRSEDVFEIRRSVRLKTTAATSEERDAAKGARGHAVAEGEGFVAVRRELITMIAATGERIERSQALIATIDGLLAPKRPTKPLSTKRRCGRPCVQDAAAAP